MLLKATCGDMISTIVVSENCRHGIVINANKIGIVCFSKYYYALLCTVILLYFFNVNIFASSVMFKTFTESYKMTYIILKHRIKETADVNSETTPS